MKLILILLLFPIIMVVQCTKEAEVTEEPTIFDEPETYATPRFYRRPRNFTQIGPKSSNNYTKEYSIARFGTIPGIILISSETPNGSVIGKLEGVGKQGTRKTNRPLTFHLDTMSDLFAIDNSSGVISTIANVSTGHSYDGQITEHCLDIGVTIENDISGLGEQTEFCIRIIKESSFNGVKEDLGPGFLERLMLCLDIIIIVGVATFICGSVVGCLICRLWETQRSFTLPRPTEPSNDSETTSKTENPPPSGAEPPSKANREHEGLRTAPYGGTEGVEERGSEDSVQLTTSTARFTRARATIGQHGNEPESQDPAEAVVAATAEPSNEGVDNGNGNGKN